MQLLPHALPVLQTLQHEGEVRGAFCVTAVARGAGTPVDTMNVPSRRPAISTVPCWSVRSTWAPALAHNATTSADGWPYEFRTHRDHRDLGSGALHPCDARPVGAAVVRDFNDLDLRHRVLLEPVAQLAQLGVSGKQRAKLAELHQHADRVIVLVFRTRG